MKFILSTTAIALLLSACAMGPTPEQLAKLDTIKKTTPVCDGEKDCQVKWDAAQLFIVKNSAWKIQTSTNVLVQTFNPPQNDTRPGMQATKEPQGNGKYQIGFATTCMNMFGCTPDVFDATLAFNDYVNKATP